MDVLAVFDTVVDAVARVRKREGPYFVEAVCYRYEGHFSGDTLKYRPKEERASWSEKDPILKLRNQLIDAEIISAEEADRLVEGADRQIDEALEFAKASPLPDPSTAWEDLYA